MSKPKRTPEASPEAASTHSIGKPISYHGISITVEGNAYDLMNAGDSLFSEGLSVISSVRDVLMSSEFEGDSGATADTLLAAEHLLQLGRAIRAASVKAGARP